MSKKKGPPPDPVVPDVIDSIKKLYKQKLLPLEEAYGFSDFHSPSLRDSDFDAKPLVTLIGQYSTGKTTFIKYMLGRSYPGMRVGPEPTTDRFLAVMEGKEDRIVPGNALAMDQSKPFVSLNKFGTGFLNKFEASEVSISALLERLTFIDTPGVLSGEKQRIGRSYDYVGVCEWFAERSDLVLLLFDAHKLDISDEFKRVIGVLKGHEDKVRIVLNKADRVGPQELLRVYGALMWSLGKVLTTPEVMRVFCGSFIDREESVAIGGINQESEEVNRKLFDMEQADLIKDLEDLPRNSTIRRINELVKRARLARVHAHLIGHLRKEMPSLTGKKKKQQELLDNMLDVFNTVLAQHKLHVGDFPNLDRFRGRLVELQCDFTKFQKINDKLLAALDDLLSNDIPRLMHSISMKNAEAKVEHNPFHAKNDWLILESAKAESDILFQSLGPTAGKLSGPAAKSTLAATGLPRDVLFQIWQLADIDNDGYLDADEFAVCGELIAMCTANPKCLENIKSIEEIEPRLVPPSKRKS